MSGGVEADSTPGNRLPGWRVSQHVGGTLRRVPPGSHGTFSSAPTHAELDVPHQPARHHCKVYPHSAPGLPDAWLTSSPYPARPTTARRPQTTAVARNALKSRPLSFFVHALSLFFFFFFLFLFPIYSPDSTARITLAIASPPALLAIQPRGLDDSTTLAMFSTFTGNSRRPRNVNLSGSAGNPFANTSWTPAVASNTTKTVSDAQADREKRQAERLKLKAAARIQRTWRGHQARSRLADHRRDEFDKLYASGNSHGRPRQAFETLLSFCAPTKPDDVRRLVQYTTDAADADLEAVFPEKTHPSRIRRFVALLVASLQSGSESRYVFAHQGRRAAG